MSKDKRPRQAKAVVAAKRPAVAAAPADPMRTRVAFQFSRLDHDGGWSLGRESADKILEIIRKLGDVDTKTWGELRGSQRHKPIPTENLCKEAQARLVELKLDDEDVLWEFGLSGRERVWGVRYEAVMSLLWWDPEHEVCPSTLRNS